MKSKCQLITVKGKNLPKARTTPLEHSFGKKGKIQKEQLLTSVFHFDLLLFNLLQVIPLVLQPGQFARFFYVL